MKPISTCIPKCLLLSLLLLSGPGNPGANAQAIQPEVLYTFKTADGAGGNELCQGPDGAFYGTTLQGGGNGFGTVFKVTTNGSFTTLAVFNVSDANYPEAGLTPGPDGFLYGVASGGGTNGGGGTMFRISTNGNLTILGGFGGLHNPSAVGTSPWAGLIAGTDGAFYGSTTQGGSAGYGTIFRGTTNGVVTTLASFAGNNGSQPFGTLAQGLDGSFYGTTYSGGVGDYGVVFRLGTDGLITRLAAFDFANGYGPRGGLTRAADGSFFGTTGGGGAGGNGSVFRVSTNGTLTTLAAFDTFEYNGTQYTNSLGDGPNSTLVAGADGNLYGTAGYGGIFGYGTVFRATPAGGLTALAAFNQTNGWGPHGLLLGKDGNFYGTTSQGGLNGKGVFYRIPGPPAITTQPASQLAFTGQSVTLAVTTAGGSPFRYQWYFKGSPLANATNSSLSLTLNDNYTYQGLYYVAVTNALGGLLSRPASLTILDPPFIVNPGISNGVAHFGVVFYSGSLLAVVEASTNLVNWVPLQTLTLNRFEVPFADAQSPLFNQRFYRVKALP